MLLQLLEERVSAVEPSLLILQAGTATRLQVAILAATDYQREFWFGPTLEELAVFKNGIEFLFRDRL